MIIPRDRARRQSSPRLWTRSDKKKRNGRFTSVKIFLQVTAGGYTRGICDGQVGLLAEGNSLAPRFETITSTKCSRILLRIQLLRFSFFIFVYFFSFLSSLRYILEFSIIPG